LLENSEASWSRIKEKTEKLLASECEAALLEQINDFEKKGDILGLIDSMTELDYTKRNITFEQVYNTLFSILPQHFSKIKCKNCIEVAEVFLKDSFDRYCETCRESLAATKDEKFYKGSVLLVNEVLDKTIPVSLENQKNRLEDVQRKNKCTEILADINEKGHELDSVQKTIYQMNGNIDLLVGLLQQKKTKLNEFYTKYHNQNKLYSEKIHSIFQKAENFIQNKSATYQNEIEKISSDQSKFKEDYDLVANDMNALASSLEQTKNLEEMVDQYSHFHYDKIQKEFTSITKSLKKDLDNEIEKIRSLEDYIFRLDGDINDADIAKLNEMFQKKSAIDEALSKAATEKDCLNLIQEEMHESRNESDDIEEQYESYVSRNK